LLSAVSPTRRSAIFPRVPSSPAIRAHYSLALCLEGHVEMSVEFSGVVQHVEGRDQLSGGMRRSSAASICSTGVSLRGVGISSSSGLAIVVGMRV
jgi:hypothetical protein